MDNPLNGKNHLIFWSTMTSTMNLSYCEWHNLLLVKTSQETANILHKSWRNSDSLRTHGLFVVMVTLTLNGAPCLHVHLVWITSYMHVNSDFQQIAKFRVQVNSSLSNLVGIIKCIWTSNYSGWTSKKIYEKMRVCIIPCLLLPDYKHQRCTDQCEGNASRSSFYFLSK